MSADKHATGRRNTLKIQMQRQKTYITHTHTHTHTRTHCVMRKGVEKNVNSTQTDMLKVRKRDAIRQSGRLVSFARANARPRSDHRLVLPIKCANDTLLLHVTITCYTLANLKEWSTFTSMLTRG